MGGITCIHPKIRASNSHRLVDILDYPVDVPFPDVGSCSLLIGDPICKKGSIPFSSWVICMPLSFCIKGEKETNWDG